MTAAAPTWTVQLPRPLAPQLPILQSSARYKLLRAGRRFGKSRIGLFGACRGHGPQALRRGVWQGGAVAWITPTYPQSRAIWREEILPRFAGVPGVDLNQSERRLTVGGGWLEVRSAESIHSVRGWELDGVVLDEAGWMDLELVWREVVRPCLISREGWAMILSTTNGGLDGNQAHEAPSYFNRLCQAAERGELGKEWEVWHRRTRDNPRIRPEEIGRLRREYAPTPQLALQELEAEYILGGAEAAFPEFTPSVHVQALTPPRDWQWCAGLDWGYRAPGWCGLVAVSPRGEHLSVQHELSWTQQTPHDVGQALGEVLMGYPTLRWIACDSAMWAVTDGGASIAEQLQQGLVARLGRAAPVLMPAPKGKTSRVARKILLHEALRYEGTPPLQAWQRPRLTVTSGCQVLLGAVSTLMMDPRRPEDVDTRGNDHPYDGLTYCLQLLGAEPQPVPPAKLTATADRHPVGYWLQPGPSDESVSARYRTGVRWTRAAQPREE